MSHNPLLSCIRPGKKFSYNLENPRKNQQQQGQYRPLQEANRSTSQRHGISTQERTNPGPSHSARSRLDKQPASKKRKTDESLEEDKMFGDDAAWGDNDFFQSQENLIKIELMESQAMSKGSTVSDPGPPGKIESVPKPSRYNSAPPTLPTASHGSGIFVRPRPADASSIHSAHNASSSTAGSSGSSDYPLNLTSSTASQSSSSLRSSSSVEIPLGQISKRPSLTAQSSSDSGDSFSTAFLRTPMIESMKEDLEKYRKQVESLQKDKHTLKEELFVKEGAIKMLRDNVAKKDAEINSAKLEKIKSMEQQNREKSEKEKQLQTENDKLTTQLQFKERDITVLQDKNQMLESRLQRMESGEQSQVLRSPSHSPKIKKLRVEEKSPLGRRGFPTKQSFMADEMERPTVPFSRITITRDAATMTARRGDSQEPSLTVRKQRKFSLKIDVERGKLTGGQLLARIDQSELGTSQESGSAENPNSSSIMALLHSRTPVMDVHQFQFDRDNNKLLSPLHVKRVSPEKVRTKCLVAIESYRLVVYGRHCIMCNRDPFLPVECHRDITSPSSSSSSSINNHSFNDLADFLLSCTNNDKCAILFLPLLNDYLTHYIDLLNASVERGPTLLSPTSSDYSSSAKSSSFDSSLESVSSSLNLLMKDGAIYANNLESQAHSSLAVLYTIVSHCPDVRNILLMLEGTDSDISVHSVNGKHISKIGKGTESDIIISSPETTSSLGTNITLQRVLDCNLLKKIFRLANPGRSSDFTDKDKKQLYRPQIVTKALEILKVLCDNATGEQIDSLLPLLSNGVLTNCLECETDPAIVLLGMDLLLAFTKFNKALSSLCVNPVGCTLCVLYSTSISYLDSFPPDKFTAFASKLISCLFRIVSCHKGGIVFLLETNCRCSVQIVKSLVLTLHRMWCIFSQEESEEVLTLLQKGLLLLHILSQIDALFTDHHYLVEHQYVQFICGMSLIIKQNPEKFESEKNAVMDLWDFNQDDSELSHDSDDDEMDVN